MSLSEADYLNLFGSGYAGLGIETCELLGRPVLQSRTVGSPIGIETFQPGFSVGVNVPHSREPYSLLSVHS